MASLDQCLEFGGRAGEGQFLNLVNVPGAQFAHIAASIDPVPTAVPALCAVVRKHILHRYAQSARCRSSDLAA